MKISNQNQNIAIEDVATIVDSELPKSQKMRNLFDAGLTINEISNLLGVRYNFVYNVMQNHILKNGYEVSIDKSSGKKEIVRELLAQGKTIAEISQEIATTYNYVWKLVHEIKAEEPVEEPKEPVEEPVESVEEPALTKKNRNKKSA